MEDDMQKALVLNETLPPAADSPPPYSPGTFGQDAPAHQHGHPPPHTVHQSGAQYPGATVINNVPPAADQPPQEVFAREACFAHCVRFWWCRPIGWLAVAELERARAMYLAGDYEGAEQAAKKANLWSTVGLVSGILVAVGVGVATYFIVTAVI